MIHPVVIWSSNKVASHSDYKSGKSDKYIYVLLETPFSTQFIEENFMPTKSPPSESTSITPVTEEFRDANQKHNLSKMELDLYHEEYDVAEKVYRVKRVSMPNKGEKWKIMLDSKVTFVIEGTKISKKEREFLETVDGFNFILAQAKIGIKSLNSFRTELKKIIDSKSSGGNNAVPKPGRPKKK